jgi:hypothetical protein
MTAVLPVMLWPIYLNTWIHEASMTIQGAYRGGLFQATALKGRSPNRAKERHTIAPFLPQFKVNLPGLGAFAAKVVGGRGSVLSSEE